MTSNQVAGWATTCIGAKHAAVLEKQEICGQALLTLRLHELVQYGMPHGPAAKLLKAVLPGVSFLWCGLCVCLVVWFVCINSVTPSLVRPSLPRLHALHALCVFLPLPRLACDALLLSHPFPLRPPTALPPLSPTPLSSSVQSQRLSSSTCPRARRTPSSSPSRARTSSTSSCFALGRAVS